MASWKTPENLKYAKSDEWYLIEGDTVTIGISDYAQEQLNDIVFVEFPDVGSSVKVGGTVGTIESVKAASELYSPFNGEVIEVNTDLESSPETVNADPYGKGWLVKLKVTDTNAPELLDAAAYIAFCESR